MPRSLRSLVALAMLSCALGGCAARRPKAAPPRRVAVESLGFLQLAQGIEPIAVAKLPPNFSVDRAFPPFWWGQGSEIAIGGKLDSRAALLGLSGPGYARIRVVGGGGDGPYRAARLLTAAPSPDGMSLAMAYAGPHCDRVAIVVRDFLDAGPGRPVASLEGAYDAAQVNWIRPGTIAVMLGERGRAPKLFGITAGAEVKVEALDKLACRLSALSYSPDGVWAVAQGDKQAPPYLINLNDESCSNLGREAVRVLAWAPDSTSFLYVERVASGASGAFRYDVASGRSVLVAISSGAAAYSRDGSMVAVGNSELTWRAARDASNRPVHLQIARWDPAGGEVQINSLGAATTPSMLSEAKMLFSTASDNSILDFEIPLPDGAERELLGYSYASRHSFPLASVNPAVPVAMSWSPDGKLLAIVDGGVRPNQLVVLAPPR